MRDLPERLADAVADEGPRDHSPERVRQSLRLHRRRQRLTAGVLGVVVAAGVVWMTAVGFTDRRTAPPSGAGSSEFLDLPRLERVWSAEVADTAFSTIGGTLADEANVYVSTTQGVIAYPKACETDPCDPAWELRLAADAPSPWMTASIAVGDGVVVAMVDGRMEVAAADCRSDGGLCSPLWVAGAPKGTNGYRSALVGDGIVLAALSAGEDTSHHIQFVAFAARCRSDGGSCDPTWTGDGGVGTLYSPGTFVNGTFYQQVGPRMVGFAADCASDGRPCPPDLVITSEGSPNNQSSSFYGPIAGDDEVIFVAGTGEVLSYPEHCGSDCRPRWVGQVADYLEAYPTRAGAVVMTSSASGVTAFPLACRNDGGRCEVAWHADLNRYTPVEYADERFVVAVSHFRDQAVFVIPTDCERHCAPLWTLESIGPIYGVASDGRSLLVATKDEILGFPLECLDPCTPIWRADITGETWVLLVDGGLVAASRTGGDIDTGLRLTGFGAN